MPNEKPAHVEGIEALELEVALDATDLNSLWAIKESLDRFAAEKETSGEVSVARSLFTLGAASSMMVDTEFPDTPFKPFARFGNCRSPALDDFEEDDLSFFERIFEQIDIASLQARIADILWLLRTNDRFKFAKIAVEAYFNAPLTNDAWRENLLESWERGLQLAKKLGGGLKEAIDQASRDLESEFRNSNLDSAYYGINIAQLFRKYSLLWSANDLAFNHFQQLAVNAKSNGDMPLALDLFKETIVFSSRDDQEKRADLSLEVANCLRSIGESSHGLFAGTKFEEAVNVLRSIPVSLRGDRDVNSQIEDLRKKIREAGEFTLEHMTHSQSPPIDLSELQNSARLIVQSETVFGSIKRLAGVYQPPKKSTLFDEARQELSQFPMQGIFQGIHYANDGRKNAVVPACDGQLHEHPETLQEIAVRNLQSYVQLICHGMISPALYAVKCLHRVRYQHFLDLCSSSLNIPNDRRHFWARALYLGFEGDFVSALHVGVPQIEHLVRVFLNRSGCITTTLDSNGIEAEVGLSALFGKSESETVFGEDLLFEMKGLLTDHFGPNLRNELAHGLASVHDCLSCNAVYVWWLMLRIACAGPKEEQDDNPTGEDTGET